MCGTPSSVSLCAVEMLAAFPCDTHRNRNGPLIQCDSLCCYSTLGRNCWITQFLMDVRFLETLIVFVVTAVCSAVGVCLLLLKLRVLIPLRAIRSWFLCNPHDFQSGFENIENAQTHMASFRCVWREMCLGPMGFYLQEPLYHEQQITIHGGCTSGCVCACISWLLAQLCCRGHTAYTGIWVKYCVCILEHCIGQERARQVLWA